MFSNKIVVGMYRSASIKTKSSGISLLYVARQTNKTCNPIVCCGSLMYFVMCFMEILPIYPILSYVLLCIRFCAFFHAALSWHTSVCTYQINWFHAIRCFDCDIETMICNSNNVWELWNCDCYELFWMWVIGV